MWFKRGSMILTLLAVASVAFIVDAGAQDIDRAIAIVNDDVITQRELEDRLAGIMLEVKSAGADTPSRAEVRDQLLERMINDKLQLQVAERARITVSPDAVDGAISAVAGRNKITLRQLRQALEKDGVPYYTFRENIETQLVIRHLVDRQIRNRVNVTQEEIDEYLSSRERNAGATAYDISHILIRLPENVADEEVNTQEAKANKVVGLLDNGGAFAEVAVAHSEARDAADGGRLGWRKPEQMPNIFVTALRDTSVGAHTPVLRSANGFHILKLNDVRGLKSVTVSQTRVKHILVRTDEFTSEAEAEERLNQVRERLENGDDFAELSKVYSGDLLSAAKGGELGWLSPGDVVTPFERAMDELKPGQLSRPVKTPYGVHLIQVLERRKREMSSELDRGNARNQLLARKTDERYERWLQRLRDESYIELIQ